MSRTSIAKADRRRLGLAVTVLTETVRMAETVADAVDGPVVAGRDRGRGGRGGRPGGGGGRDRGGRGGPGGGRH